MTMTMEHNNNRHLGSMGLDHLPYSHGPHFTNPFNASNNQMYHGMSSNNVGFDAIAKQNVRSSSAQLPFSHASTAAPPLHAHYQNTPYQSHDLLGASQDLINSRNSYDQSAPPVNSFAPTSAPFVNGYGAVTSGPQEESRRVSHT